MLVEADELHGAIKALHQLDSDTVTDAELHELVVAVQRERARLGAVAAKLLGRWDRRGVWAADGSRSAAARLARETSCATSSAKVELRRARQLASMPATAAAVTDGRLSLDHVDLLGRANRPWRNAVFADHEQALVDECAKLRFAEAARVVAYWCQRADAEAAEEEGRLRHDAAGLHASTTLDGDVELTGRLDPVGGAILMTELDRLERELYLADEREGIVRSRSQRQAAALVEMAKRSATAPEHGRRPRPLFTVLLGDDSFTTMCELANGTVIAPGQLVPWLGAAERETMLFDGKTTVISVSQRRTFVGAVRRAIEMRDRHCQHPSGCDVRADRCDVDHIVPFPISGETSQFGGRLECPPHNRDAAKHDHDAQPRPHREVTRIDELRALIRWRNRHLFPADDDADHDDDERTG